MSEERLEPDTKYKVGRVLAEYGLLELHDALPDRWLGNKGEEISLRDLAAQINIALLRQRLEEAGEHPLEGEAENAYRLLTDEDVSVGVRTEQRNRLKRVGIDVDALEQDFVTHQAVYTYLTKAHGLSKEPDDRDPIETHKERIQRLRNRTKAVVENSLAELSQDDKIAGGSFEALIDIQVYCGECNTQTQASALFESGGCECE